MKTADKILDLLEKNKGKAISGERIAEVLGISRTAVWKHIKALKEEGYEISSVRTGGMNFLKPGMCFQPRVLWMNWLMRNTAIRVKSNL